jgi:hypothetical protein
MDRNGMKPKNTYFGAILECKNLLECKHYLYLVKYVKYRTLTLKLGTQSFKTVGEERLISFAYGYTNHVHIT